MRFLNLLAVGLPVIGNVGVSALALPEQVDVINRLQARGTCHLSAIGYCANVKRSVEPGAFPLVARMPEQSCLDDKLTQCEVDFGTMEKMLNKWLKHPLVDDNRVNFRNAMDDFSTALRAASKEYREAVDQRAGLQTQTAQRLAGLVLRAGRGRSSRRLPAIAGRILESFRDGEQMAKAVVGPDFNAAMDVIDTGLQQLYEVLQEVAPAIALYQIIMD